MGLHVIDKQSCNMCGKELELLDRQENFGLHYKVGYGSKYDLNEINIDLCCDCFDKIMDYILPMCKINPIKEYNLRDLYPQVKKKQICNFRAMEWRNKHV